ncbi:MAG: hypothetical protein V5A28_12860, partial [Haloarculaceae archaeon]
MPSFPTYGRRTVLAAGATALASLAGCGTDATGENGSSDPADSPTPSDVDGSSEADTPAEGSGPESSTAETDTRSGENDASAGVTATRTAAPGDATPTPDLDLREANVVGVAFAGGDGTYDFDVTLYHDDDGEDGYANWWQVESLDGAQLGRRTLLHAHSTDPFTR